MNKHEAAERENKAVQLRAQGKRLDEIAKALGYADPSGAHRAISRALSKQQAIGIEEYRAMSAAHLDELDAQAAATMSLPGVGIGDMLRAIETRRKIVLSRGEVLGIKQTMSAANVATTMAPDAGPSTLTVVILDGAPAEVLPPNLEAVAVIPTETYVIGIDPDWALPPAGIGVFSRDGKLKLGNLLVKCEPQELASFLAWHRQQSEARWAQQAARRSLPSQSAGDNRRIPTVGESGDYDG